MPTDSNGKIASKDYQALSLFRILFSIFLMVEFCVNTFTYFSDFYGEAGILPISALSSDSGRPGLLEVLPLLKVVDSIQYFSFFPVLYFLALFGFAIGYKTRWFNAIVFLLSSYLYWRNPYIDSGAETLARLLLFWSLFLPMARYWSIDAALDPRPRDRGYPTLPFVAIRVQISSLYLFAALFKIAGEPWREGSAIIWVLSDNVFGGTQPGLYLVKNFPGLLFGVNYLVIVFQFAFPFLIYCPWRNELVRALAIAGAVVMHVSFIFLLNVGAFPYVCMVMLILLVPDSWIDKFFCKRRERQSGITIYYEPGCAFCQRVSLILREFLLSPTSPVLAASADPQAQRLLSEHQSWVIRGTNGAFYLKWRAMSYLLRQNGLLAPCAWALEHVGSPLDQTYDIIGRSRRWLGPITKVLFPFNSQQPIGRPALVVCGFIMVLTLLGNVLDVAQLSFPGLRGFEHITATLQVRQSWRVFAPGPVHWQRTYGIETHHDEDRMIDLKEALSKPIIESQTKESVLFSSTRWAKYFTRLDELNEEAWSAFGSYLCRVADRRLWVRSDARRLVFIISTEPVKGTPLPLVPIVRRQFECAMVS
jgi:hypothetical protein